MKHIIIFCCLSALAAGQDLADLAKNGAQLRSTFKSEDLTKASLAYMGDNETVLFAVETNKDTDKKPALS